MSTAALLFLLTIILGLATLLWPSQKSNDRRTVLDTKTENGNFYDNTHITVIGIIVLISLSVYGLLKMLSESA
jgi:hypothetical protein